MLVIRKVKANHVGSHPLLVKRLQLSTDESIALLITQLFSAGVVPDAREKTTIVPVFNKAIEDIRLRSQCTVCCHCMR